MAGGGGSLGAERSKRGKSKRKSKKRAGFHIDMTPLVDITFLLLTFFMFTTTMASPQIMEMSIPPEVQSDVEVKASELFTIYLRDDNKLFSQMGTEEPELIELDKVRALTQRTILSLENPNRMITALKVGNGADYGLVVDILDELNLAEVGIMEEISKMADPETGEPMQRERRFTIAQINDEEMATLQAVEPWDEYVPNQEEE